MIDTRNDYEVALGAFRNAVDPRIDDVPRVPGLGRPQPPSARRPQDRHVLHRRHSLREGHRLCPLARLAGNLPPQGRDPEISGNRAGRARACGRANASSSTSASRSRMAWRRARPTLCRACRRPLTGAERQSPLFREGVSCAHCHDQRSEADRARYAERQRQVAPRASARCCQAHRQAETAGCMRTSRASL